MLPYHPRLGLWILLISDAVDAVLYPIQGGELPFIISEAKLMVAVLAKSAPLINKILPYLARFFWLVPQLVGYSRS
jgi:hypothetical protein